MQMSAARRPHSQTFGCAGASRHLQPRGKLATRANVKTVVLTHFLPATDPKDGYERLGEQVKQHFSGTVLVAKDLMEF
jgi:ribonuclease BN (tRNA processing enzyme)